MDDQTTFNSVAEHIIEFATEFFSFKKNIASGAIENIFLPVIMCYSQKMSGGKILDTKIFKQVLTDEQLDFCARIFTQAGVLKLQTNRINPKHLFQYIGQFAEAKELELTIFDDDEFEILENKFDWSKLSITCLEQNLYAQAVETVLLQCNPVLETLNITGGYLNTEGLLHLIKNNIRELHLSDVRLYTDADRDTLIKFILRSTNLESLKLTALSQRLYLNSFNDIFEKLMISATSPMNNLRKLSFTIGQDIPGCNYALLPFPNLTQLELYYTVEKSFGNIHQIINALNTHRGDRTCNPAVIIFKEYLMKKSPQYTEAERVRFKKRSNDFRVKIIDQCAKYVAVQTLPLHDI